MVTDRVDDLLEAFITQHISQNRSAPEVSRMLRREVGSAWGSRSIHEITKRNVIDVVSVIQQRGAPVAANKALKAIKTFFRWCVGRAVLDRSPADGVPLPTKEKARDRVLSDDELAQVIVAARRIGGPYGDIVEVLALTGQRREEVARCTWKEFDIAGRTWKLSSERTKNAKAHEVYPRLLTGLRPSGRSGCTYHRLWSSAQSIVLCKMPLCVRRCADRCGSTSKNSGPFSLRCERDFMLHTLRSTGPRHQLGLTGSVTTIAETHYVEMNNEMRDVVKVCNEYVALLTRVVSQAKPNGP
jgi:integrase